MGAAPRAGGTETVAGGFAAGETDGAGGFAGIIFWSGPEPFGTSEGFPSSVDAPLVVAAFG